MKKIVCDASSLISMSDNCLLWLLPSYKTEFIVPEEVRREIIDRPIKNERFEFKAMRLQQAIDAGMIKVVSSKGVSSRATEIANLANSLFRYGKHDVKLIHGGEAESIALMEKQGIQTLLIDERTTRLVIEDRVSLKKYIQKRTGFHLKVNNMVEKQLGEDFGHIDVIRSTELIAWAYEQGLLAKFGHGKELLHASLYGLKYSGCAISRDEIEEYMKLFT